MKIAVALAAASLLTAGSAQAATYLVDTTNDSDAPAFQVCDANPMNANCSLRGALTAADANAGSHIIQFDLSTSDPGYIASTAHWRFAPATNYPFVTNDLVIDGYSQAGSAANTNTPDQGGSNAVLRIEIRGPGASSQLTGLQVTNSAAALTLRGIAISGFQANLALDTFATHHIEGCFIGTDITGMLAGDTSNGSGFGIRSSGPSVIGGVTPAARNVISGNPYLGISNSNGAALTVQGNLIGTNATGTAALPGQDYGVFLDNLGGGGIIGGASAQARNVISGNTFSAVYVFAQFGGANPQILRVLGNYFGTDVGGTQPIGNGTNPESPSQPVSTISAFGANRCGMEIGGTASGEGNLIAFGGAAGVQIASCGDTPILGNRFHRNRGVGIDLSETSNADGYTPNDPGDPDGNPPPGGGSHFSSNRLQNFPEIVSLAYSNGGATIQLSYRVDTALANATYPLRVDIGRGRGNQSEGSILTDTYPASSAQLAKTVSFPASALQGEPLVLSVTDAAGNSSEFGGDDIFGTGFE